MRFRNRVGYAALFVLPALFTPPVFAADHGEAPGTQADAAADIADVYAWTTAGRTTLVLTFAGLKAPVAGQSGTYDDDVIYQIYIDRNADNTADATINVRFGKNGNDEWGVQATGVPGRTSPLEGDVGTTITDSGTSLWAGLRDEPFFFDLEGFNATIATGDLSFMNTRDSVAGLNCTAIVIEMPQTAAFLSESSINVWATTGRK